MKKIVHLLFLVLIYSNLSATIYYVSKSGSNSNTGLSPTDAFAHPGYATKQMKSADTLVIQSGEYILETYWDDMLTPPSGKANASTAIYGYGITRPVLRCKGTAGLGLSAAIDLAGGSNIYIDYLEITSEIDEPYSGGLRDGVQSLPEDVDAADSNIVLSRLIIHHIEETGINLTGNIKNLRILDSEIFNTGGTLIGSRPKTTGKGWTNVIINNCKLKNAGRFYQGQDQISQGDRPDGIGIEESEGPIEIGYTTCEFNLGDGFDSKAQGTFFHNCISANNFGDGFKVWGKGSKLENCLIYGVGGGNPESTPWVSLIINCNQANGIIYLTNITVHDGSPRGHYICTFNYDEQTSIQVIMRNCIFQGETCKRLYSNPNVFLMAQNNIFYILGEDVMLQANGSDYTMETINNFGNICFSADAQFIKPSWGEVGNYHLLKTSPAIDTGVGGSGIPSIDLDGRTRPLQGKYDIGCYEYDPSVDVLEIPKVADKFEAFPNPAMNELFISSTIPMEDIKLFDLNAKEVLSIAHPGFYIEKLDLTGLASGNYIAVITSGDNKYTLNVVVAK